MTPDEHRAKAEELRLEAEKIEAPHRRTPETRDRLIAEATLHALLALGEEPRADEAAQHLVADGKGGWTAARRDRHDVTPNGYIAGEDILAGAVLGTDPATGHLVMVGRIEPKPAAQPSSRLTDDEAYEVFTGIDFRWHELAEARDTIDRIIAERLARLTSEPALAAFREAWLKADEEGAEGDRVRRGMVAAIEAVS